MSTYSVQIELRLIIAEMFLRFIESVVLVKLVKLIFGPVKVSEAVEHLKLMELSSLV